MLYSFTVGRLYAAALEASIEACGLGLGANVLVIGDCLHVWGCSYVIHVCPGRSGFMKIGSMMLLFLMLCPAALRPKTDCKFLQNRFPRGSVDYNCFPMNCSGFLEHEQAKIDEVADFLEKVLEEQKALVSSFEDLLCCSETGRVPFGLIAFALVNCCRKLPINSSHWRRLLCWQSLKKAGSLKARVSWYALASARFLPLHRQPRASTSIQAAILVGLTTGMLCSVHRACAGLAD